MKSKRNGSEFGFTLIEVIITLVVVAIVGAMMTAYFGTSITQSSLPIFRLSDAAKLNMIMEKITAVYGQYAHWRPNTTYAAGTVILPTTLNRTGLLYTTTAGKSGTVEPTWPKTQGSSVSKDGVTYTTVWPTTPNVAAPTLVLNDWLPSHQYYIAPASIVYPTDANGNQYICITGGISGGSRPLWRTDSTPFSDGAVTWQWVGPVPTLILKDAIGTEGANSNPGTNPFGSYHIIHNRFIRFVNNNEDEGAGGNPLATTDPDYGKYLKVTISLPSNPNGEKLTTLFVPR